MLTLFNVFHSQKEASNTRHQLKIELTVIEEFFYKQEVTKSEQWNKEEK
jgi:hypothetical protein